MGEAPVAPLLDTSGPQVLIGTRPHDSGLAQPIAPSRSSLFGPRGAALTSPAGPLVVADTGHHRVLIWGEAPQDDFQDADLVIGQHDFCSEGRNGKADVGAATLNVPTGVAVRDNVLAVADAWNHRVLIWHGLPERSNQPADIVLGQSDFAGADANRGGEAGAATLNWCYGVAFLGNRLAVADTGNRRVLVWNDVPQQNGQPADLVLGQVSFQCRDESAGMDAGPLGMRWPHAVSQVDSSIVVADAGSNRIMVWRTMPDRPGSPCDFVLGQGDTASLEHNRGRYLPDAGTLNMPYGLASLRGWLIAADTANSRLLGWTQLSSGAAADALAGQVDFGSKGDNRWQAPVRDSLCWPYSISPCGDVLVVADTGNNRVMLWRAAI